MGGKMERLNQASSLLPPACRWDTTSGPSCLCCGLFLPVVVQDKPFPILHLPGICQSSSENNKNSWEYGSIQGRPGRLMGSGHFQGLETSALLRTPCPHPDMSAVFYLKWQYFSDSNWPRLRANKRKTTVLSWDYFFLFLLSLTSLPCILCCCLHKQHLLSQACSFVVLKPTR